MVLKAGVSSNGFQVSIIFTKKQQKFVEIIQQYGRKEI